LPFSMPQFRYIDMLGLNDLHIAKTQGIYDSRARNMVGHQKADAAYVLSKKPDVIILSTSNYDLRHASDFQMMEQREFMQDYLRVEYLIIPDKIYGDALGEKELTEDGRLLLAFYVRKDYAHYFRGYKIIPINPDLFSGHKPS